MRVELGANDPLKDDSTPIRRTRSRGCATVAFAVCCFAAAQAKPVVSDAEIGVAGLVRAGGWNRVAATIRAEGAAVAGVVTAAFGEEPVARSLTIPANGLHRWEDAVRVAPLSTSGEVRFRSDDDESRTEITATVNVSDDDVSALALARERGTMSHIADRPCAEWMPSGRAPTGRFVVADTGVTRSLPATWAGWRSVDIVVWNAAVESVSWTEAQRRAFEQWLYAGGTLVVVADERAGATFPLAIRQRLPVTPMAWETLTLPSQTGKRESARALSGALRNDARALLTVENRVIIAARDVGMGRAITVGVPSPSLEFRDALWRTVFSEARLSPVRESESRSKSDRSRILDRLTAPRETGIRFPLRARIAALVGASLAAAAAMLAFLARRMPRWAFVFVAVCFAAVAFAPAARRPTRERRLREWGVMRVFPEIGEGLWRGALTLEPTSAREVRARFAIPPYLDALDADTNGTRVVFDDGGELRDAIPNATRERHWEASAFVPFAGRVTAEALTDVSVRLANQTALDFERIGIVRGDAVAFLDRFAAGDAADAHWQRFDSRRQIWSAFVLPTPLFSFWARENYLDALMNPDASYVVGWTLDVSAFGFKGVPSSGNALLLIVPIDITAAENGDDSPTNTRTAE